MGDLKSRRTDRDGGSLISGLSDFGCFCFEGQCGLGGVLGGLAGAMLENSVRIGGAGRC